jgi:hypothetical protein
VLKINNKGPGRNKSEQNQSKRALDESLKGGFFYHPIDEDLSLGTPERKKPLEGSAPGYSYSDFAIAANLWSAHKQGRHGERFHIRSMASVAEKGRSATGQPVL